MHDTHTHPEALTEASIHDSSRPLSHRADAADARVSQPVMRQSRWQAPGEPLRAFCTVLLFLLAVWAGTFKVHADSDYGSGALVLHSSSGDIDALQLDADMLLHVKGLLADLTLTQSFQNTTDRWVEGSYLFPLPPEATIRGLRLQLGERIIDATIQRRDEAEQLYAAASEAGQVASLVEQQRPNLFTMNVSNIAPGETIQVILDVMLPVDIVEDRLQLTLPTTLTPRYTNPQSTNAAALQTPFALPAVIRGPHLDLTLSIDPLTDYATVTSNTPGLQPGEASATITGMPMHQDLVFSWPVQFDVHTQTHAYVSTHAGERYVQLLVNPPATVEADQLPSRELILVVDKSGSMAGVSMMTAVEALNHAIDGLGENDYLNIVAFDDRTYPLFSTARQATDEIRRQARRFANGLRADGGTEMADALDFALAKGPSGADRLRQIVFMTDGSVGYEEVLLRRIRQVLGSSRLFTVGIGPAPNAWFLEKAAEAGRGVTVSIQDVHDVAGPITQLLNTLTSPVITDAAVQYPRGQGEIYPRPLPDLYAGRPGMWVTRVSSDVDEIVLTGLQQGQRWRRSVLLPDASEEPEDALASSAPSLALYWTRRRIDSLLDERRASQDLELHKEAITQLALEVGLVTAYTSFVAIESMPVRPLETSLDAQQVASLLPRGNMMMDVAMPRGAAGADTLAWLSALLGALFVLARVWLKRSVDTGRAALTSRSVHTGCAVTGGRAGHGARSVSSVR